VEINMKKLATNIKR
jgi:hypothetical protein